MSQWKGHAYGIFWNNSVSEVSQPAAHTAVTSLLRCSSTVFHDPECPTGRTRRIDKYWDRIAAFFQQVTLFNVSLICIVSRLYKICKTLVSPTPSQWISSDWNSPPWGSKGMSDRSCKGCVQNTGNKAKISEVSHLS